MEEKKNAEEAVKKETAVDKAKGALNSAKTKAGDVVSKCKEDKKYLYKTCGIAVGAVVVLVLVILLLLGGGNKGRVRKYMKAYEKLDYKTIVNMMYPEQAEDLEDTYEKLFEQLDKQDFKLKEWEIVDAKKVEGSKLEKIQDAFEDKYDVKVKAAEKIKVKVKVKVGDNTNTEKEDFYFVKVKGKWYLLSA